ncbi:hypothetical protein K456DRAFT_1943790 [Colletotrichum gloeosporioides 23]|nr:hypothetical protein K456DRAFT_1943790 [Colletotrichum gloeosporioides 23]
MVGQEYAVASAKDDTHSSNALEATIEGDIVSEFVDEFLAEQSADAAATTSNPGAAAAAAAAAAATQEDPSQTERTLQPRTWSSYQEMSNGKPMSKSRYATARSVTTPRIPQRCCPPEVPSMFLAALDNPLAFSTDLARIYSFNLDQLCHRHLQLFAKSVVAPDLKAGNSVGDQYNPNVTPLANPSDLPQTSPPRRRTASLPDINQPVPLLKRPRLGGSHTHWTGSRDTGHRPLHNQIADEAYCMQVLAGLQESNLKRTRVVAKLTQFSVPRAKRQGELSQDLRTSQFLQKASSSSDGMVETGQLRSSSAVWKTLTDLSRCRYPPEVPRSGHSKAGNSVSPLPPSILPTFLTGENCQLLPRVRDMVLTGRRAERAVASGEQWNEWRDVLEWVLLSEGGHNTAPHIDSHGLGTWITAQEGYIGFGWMSRPTRQEWNDWTADPQGYTGGRWRYVILRPGQTVFFDSGTIHLVFRARGEQTLALGGHILLWSSVERWLQIVIEEVRNPTITNEDINRSAPTYVQAVARLVAARVNRGRVEELGGGEAIARFFDSVKVMFFKRLWIVSTEAAGRLNDKLILRFACKQNRLRDMSFVGPAPEVVVTQLQRLDLDMRNAAIDTLQVVRIL